MEKNNHIRSLYHRHINGKTSVKETDELFEYFGSASEKDLRQLIDATLTDPEQEDSSEASPLEQTILKRIDTHIYRHIAPLEENSPAVFHKRLSFVRWSAAAAILIVSGWFLSQYLLSPTDGQHIGINSPQVHDQEPGRSRALLTLADGQRIELHENEEGITVTGDEIKYNDGPSVAEVSSSDRLNTISTPRGGQYQIILSDGTKVWLNAATTLRYPNVFKANERVVELDGEGYFEVAKNPDKPFKVVSKEQVVQVLGTHFNVNTYPEEASVKTTLSEGVVRVTSLTDAQSVELLPGSQSVLSSKGIQVRNIDTEAIIAWKNDDFIFREQSLQTTMRQLSRWYDVEVAYADSAPMHLKIGGSVSRKNSLSNVLKAMESTNSIKFEFDGKTILVK